LFGIFLIWRLSRAWDLDEEKILDLTLLTFLGGFLGARIYFAIQHPELFSGVFKIFLINKVPGFSFWGAVLGGWLTLFFLARIKKLDFLKIGDIASVGFLGGLIFASLGCFFGGCNVGIPSKMFLAVSMIGMVGKRFPVQLLEAILLGFITWRVWSTAIHFHTRGKILSISLMYVGVVKFLLEPLRQTHDEGSFLSIVLFVLGVTMLYKVTKRSPINDLKAAGVFSSSLITDGNVRKQLFGRFKKYCYNRKTSVLWKIRNLKKTLRRRNVRFS